MTADDERRDIELWEFEANAADIRPCPVSLGFTLGVCGALAAPATDAYVMGQDQDNNLVWFRRWECASGHHFDLEETEGG